VVEILVTDAQLRGGKAISLQAQHSAAGNRVFLVHGHNEAVLNHVARLLEKLKLPVTILREQPNQGRTIIEKFIDYCGVAFAVIFLTADDRGGPKDASYENQQSRPRQNVLFEPGFFVGELGRKACLCSLRSQCGNTI